jgi:hypothetical protein
VKLRPRRRSVGALRLRERHADDLGRARHAQRDGLGRRHLGLLVVDGAALRFGVPQMSMISA